MKKIIDSIVLFFKSNYYLLTAVLYFLSYPSFDVPSLKSFPLFAWIAYVPLFMYIRNKSIKQVFLVSFITFFWASVLTYQWIGNFGQKVAGGYSLIIIVVSLALAVYFSVSMLMAVFFAKRFPGLHFVIVPASILLFNWIQTLGFIAFPWPFIGYSQYPFKQFIQVASVTGIFGVSFIILLFNSLLADVVVAFISGKGIHSGWKRITEYKRFIVWAIIVVVIITGGQVRIFLLKKGQGKDPLRVSIVQSCIDPWASYNNVQMELDDLDTLLNLTKDSFTYAPEFIVWSESATLRYISTRYRMNRLLTFEKRLLQFVSEYNIPLLTGEIGWSRDENGKGRAQNNAVLIRGDGHVDKSYSKIHLVPFGEWFPYRKTIPVIGRLVDSFGASRFKPGDTPVLFDLKKKKFGVLICYEGIFHRLCREYRNLGADFLINITNDGWTDTYNGHMQHYSASVFRAIENGIWYVRAGNTGYSTVIDPFGVEGKSIPILHKGFVVDDIDFSKNINTVYSGIGDVIIYMTWLFFVILLLLMVFKRVKSAGNS